MKHAAKVWMQAKPAVPLVHCSVKVWLINAGSRVGVVVGLLIVRENTHVRHSSDELVC